MNVAVVEDDNDEAEVLMGFMRRYESENGVKLAVTRFSSAESFLNEYRRSVFSIVFMDIDLPGINGIDAARELRRIDGLVTLVFITKMAQYAYRGYEFAALDFMIKPVKYNEFCLKFRRAMNVAQANEVREIYVPLNSGFTRLTTDKIIFVEVMGHTIKYKLTDGEIVARGTLSSVEKALEGNGFLRCNSCYIVNTRFIDTVRGYDLEIAGYTLKISHPRRKEFVKALMALYMGGNGGGGGID